MASEKRKITVTLEIRDAEYDWVSVYRYKGTVKNANELPFIFDDPQAKAHVEKMIEALKPLLNRKE